MVSEMTRRIKNKDFDVDYVLQLSNEEYERRAATLFEKQFICKHKGIVKCVSY